MNAREIPGMPNAHSHAFQRGLRGAGEPRGGDDDDFWTWREGMFALAGRLEPENAERMAQCVFAEMRTAGYRAVGEFHYVHHRPDGRPYADPNAMAKAHARAAEQVGLPIVLLPAAYHRNGWDGGDVPARGAQRRFVDARVEDFLDRVDALRGWAAPRPLVHVGIAAHSVRAVPADWLSSIADYARDHALVAHVHAHEQVAEIAACRAEHACTPIELLAAVGFLGPQTSVVHATHVDQRDVALLAEHGCTVVACPTTEGNLGDGTLPAMRLAQAGIPIAVGSDSQVRVDPFEELREMETGARRELRRRSALLARHGDLWAPTAAAGRRSLGLPAGAVTDTVLDLDAPDLTGVAPDHLAAALATCASARCVVPVANAESGSSIRDTLGASALGRRRIGGEDPTRPEAEEG
jgi:formimidoylglutamate deiminase